MEVLTRCRHNGFPVVRSSLGDDEDSGDFDAAGQGASRSGSLQGLILRSQILVMLRHQVCTGVLALLKLLALFAGPGPPAPIYQKFGSAEQHV